MSKRKPPVDRPLDGMKASSAALPVRRVGTPAAMLAALAAACVLAACGPDDPTDQVARTPLALVDEPAERSAPSPAPDEPAVTVPAALVKPVDERRDRTAPRAVFGQVSAIEPIHSSPKASGTGAVVGGLLGAVVGNQVGSGTGRAAATVLGGVGGAVVGNKVEKHRSESVVGYRVHVQLDNGNTRSFERNALNGLDVGDRVRVDGGRLREV
jgi:outer membrane lipoprotein SlyB